MQGSKTLYITDPISRSYMHAKEVRKGIREMRLTTSSTRILIASEIKINGFDGREWNITGCNSLDDKGCGIT